MKNLSIFLIAFWLPLITWAQQLPWPSESTFSDSYGYIWKTNSAPDGPVFDWIDITQVGEEVNGLADDNTVGPIKIGMDFPYYWTIKDQIWIGDNGYISFSSGIPIASSQSGFPLIPTQDNTDDILAPFMADMDAGGNNNPTKVYTWFDSLNQRFIVSYHEIPFYADNAIGFSGANTFQIILDGKDSTITFQYLKQDGNWDATYDGFPYPFVVGIENVIGNMGLMPNGIPITANLKPVDSTAIRFYPPSEPQILIPDAEISWVSNPENGGSFFPWSAGKGKHLAVAQIANAGLVDIDTPLFVAAHYIRPSNGEILHADTLPVAFLKQNESRYLIFKKAFKPASAGNYALKVFITNPDSYSDLNEFNNINETEIVAVDSTKDTVRLSYSNGFTQSTLFSAGFAGTGLYFEPYGFPVEVIALEYFVLSQGSGSPFQIQLFNADTNGVDIPGKLLYQESITTSQIPLGGNWFRVDMPIPFRIDTLGFYASYISLGTGNNTVLITEETAPISQRSFDIIDGDWVVSRSNTFREPLIRAIVTVDQTVATVGVEESITQRPSISLFPNPSEGLLNITLKQTQSQSGILKIINLQGQKVFLQYLPPFLQLTKAVDLQYLPAGSYSIQLIQGDKLTQKLWMKY